MIADLNKLNLPHEDSVNKYIKSGAVVVDFSGDKMLGGPQSGVILSSKKILKKIKINSIYRTVRCDKITIALLEQVIRTYSSHGFSNLNLTLSLLTRSRDKLRVLANNIIKNLTEKNINQLGLTVEDSLVEAGSGSLPEKNIESIAIVIIMNPQ